MARSKNFDEKEVLGRAMHLFWRNGYYATSMQQLVDATGLSRSSLYETFGGKESLFLAAIELYLDEINRKRVTAMLNSESAREGIETFFSGIVDFSINDGKKLGCLLTNSAIEFCAGKGRIEERIFGVFSTVEDAFTETIKRGQKTGDISSVQNPREIACFLMTQVQGMRVMSRVNPKREWLQNSLAITLAILGDKKTAA